MNTSNSGLKQPLNSNGFASANPPGDKPEDLPLTTAYTGQMWMQDMLESCKRMNSDEAYRKEVAKRLF